MEHSGLAAFLIDTWDRVRRDHEPLGKSTPLRQTSIGASVEIDERFLTVTLAHNRFCFCKGSSHISNNIYLVVDKEGKTFKQKCFDPDCKYYSSPVFPVPPMLLECDDDEEEEGEVDEDQNNSYSSTPVNYDGDDCRLEARTSRSRSPKCYRDRT